AIKTLAVRGAPAIGVAAAYAIAILAKAVKTSGSSVFFKKLDGIIKNIISARPTAVNLFWAADKMKAVAVRNRKKSVSAIKNILLNEAKKIQQEDELMCDKIGIFGSKLIKSNDAILTHCNAGLLATAGSGTALSAIYKAKKQKKKIKVYADETRPLLQGARLTAWELRKKGIDVTLICDNTAASLIKSGKINKILVGADRIAKNGDFANKIGTYSLAVLAKVHKIPFYVLAPSSTFDFNIKTGKEISIEQRPADEVRKIKNNYISPKNVKVYNPAFDVTQACLVTAFVTEKGIFKKPYKDTLSSLRATAR
ncbi:MAG: S-methyl-5-thioribose-1-phosphate isomerase, partial [Candidatus Omnitrophica bacterium]|nr:S-methyl-5-thioribose-1-phosphate isomerase [Candidatus Omnitrophota bacterium]